jgi:2-methylcitrate dehydratase PrpD
MIAEYTLPKVLALAALPDESLSKAGRALAAMSLFDWLVVARAGAQEPLSHIIRAYVMDESGRADASVVGASVKAPARAAALANGTISHALDYDDTHFAHIGHLSVGVMPAALAVAEAVGAPATAVRDAFLVGAEAACRIGMVLGRKHYERGFHQTATAGAFGATVAAGRLLGLTGEEMRNGLSLVSTRASGLKSQFGTMGKPVNAGVAASNGVEAALLAQRGMVSCDDGLGGPQGFIDTHAEEALEAEAWAEPPPARFLFEDNKYKLHACCHGAHAMLNALVEARRTRQLSPERVEKIVLRTNPRWLRVCDIKAPRTGLEAKFSYGLLAGMAIAGVDTAADRSYVDSLCADPVLLEMGRRVTVTGDQAVSDTAAELVLTLRGGEEVRLTHDLAVRVPPQELAQGLRAKAAALLGQATADRLWAATSALDDLSARDLGGLLRPEGDGSHDNSLQKIRNRVTLAP